MKRFFVFSTIVLALVVQSACSAPTAAPQSPTSAAVKASPSPAPPPTATATLALPVAPGTLVPSSSTALSSQNIADITEVARWGYGRVSDAAYSPDGKAVAVATAIGVSIFEVDTLARTMSFDTPSPVNALAFSSDGATLVTGLFDNAVVTWNATTGSMLKSYEGKTKVITDPKRAKEQVTTVAFSDDGSLLAAGSSEGYVNVWNVSDGSVVQSLTNHVLQVTRVFFAVDGKAIFSASLDGTVRLTQLSDGQLVRAFGGQAVRDAALSKDGKTLATNDQNLYGGVGYVILRDVESGRELKRMKAGDYNGRVQSIAFSPDGQSIASGWSDYTVKVWNVSDGSLQGTLEDLRPKEQLPEGWVFVIYPVVRFSPDGKSLAWAGDDSVAFLNATGTALLKRQVIVTGQVWAISLSADGQTLASNESLEVRLRNFEDGSPLPDQAEKKSFGNVAMAPDGNAVAMGFLDAKAEHSAALLWPLAGQEPAKNFDTSLPFAWSIAAFPPDGQTLALGVSREIVFFNLADGTLVKTIHSGLGSDFWDLVFSPDGTMLAVSAGNTTKIMRVDDGKSLKNYNNGGGAIVFSPDGALLAGSDFSKNVSVWKVPTDEALVTIADNPENVLSLCFTKDGTILFGGLGDGTIIAWSMPDGAVLKSWQAHSQGISGLIPSPDGNLLISSAYDGTIRVWGLKP